MRARGSIRARAWVARSGNWIVSSWTGKGKATDVIRTHRIRRGKAPVTVPRTLIRGSGSGVQLARGGAQILVTRGHRGGNEHWIRRTSDGRLVDTAWTGPSVYTLPFDAADGRVLLHRQDTDGTKYAADWTPGATDRRVGPGLNAGFLRQDVVFVGPAPETPAPHAYGPTSISSPGTPAWSARFTALSVSPDGKGVIGTGARFVKGRAVLQVRRMTDGTVLQQFSYGRVVPKGSRALWSPESADQTARFEDSSRFVFELAQGRRAWLVRCSTAGRCARATGPGGAVSSAYERTLW